jgi:hypothetical protein
MSATRFFTVEEANALLPRLEPLMARMLERRAKVVRMRSAVENLIEDIRSDVGGRFASEMTLDFVAIEKLKDEIQSYGCIIKSIDAGLLDFLTRRDGRIVYLCWRYGEPEVAFYHELHTGFSGRRRV